MFIRKTLSARRFLAALTLLASVVSNTEALLGQVRDGREHSESSAQALQHVSPMSEQGNTLTGENASPNPQHDSAQHSHIDSIDHCSHQHTVGMAQSFCPCVGVVFSADPAKTPLADHRYLPDRSTKEPPRV